MRRRTEARHLRATVVIATVAMIAGLELGAVFRPKMATATIVRPKMAALGSTWTRNRRFAAPFNSNSLHNSPGRNGNQPLDSQDGGLFLVTANGFSPRMHRRSDAKRSSLVELVGPGFRGRKTAFDRKNRRTMTSYPDYVAPQGPTRRRLENIEAIGNLSPLSFGSRTPWKESSNPGKKGSPNYYFLASKRQPPPGFHAIRGKRRSDYYENETESETQNETETETDDGPSSVSQLLADLEEIS